MAMSPSVSFGYCVEAPIEWSALLELARELDANSRFDSFWMPDALVAHDAAKLEPFTVLAAVAQVTSRMRLGTLVAGNVFRHPAVLAQTVATLDQISGGRITLGLGAGWPGENRRYGVEFWRRPERLARLDEALGVVKLLWSEEPPSFEGRYYRLDAPPFRLATVQRPHPPILVGGGSDAALRVIARHADLASPMIPLPEARAKVEAFAREVGRSVDHIRWCGGGSLFLHDDPRVREEARRYALEHYSDVDPDNLPAELFGSAAAVREGVARQTADGATEIIVFQLPRVHLKSLVRFSEDVIPAFV
jgi:alkanesulfonate monooxygenase SsuD/methylene tetrahydromethanopterin reductase-like flavin-dependent oxidoreductase (luciferase family)